jgi:5-methylcytosine-specific restriction endonuclease McrBC GTP-binding regulatory subunit McrB
MGFSTKSISFKKANGGTSHTLSKNTLKECFNGQRESFPKGLAIYYKPVFEKLQTFSPEIESESENERPLNHVLIIDEINRGNVSQIFGELITLIEPDKRNDKKEEISVTLPYSKDEFTVPSNLYIIGTMNTADRSVEALDTALRRRFSFKAMLPEPEKLAENCEGINLQKLLNAVNSRLEVLKDLDHTVGHAWFWNVNNLKDLKEVYANKILPLLQEFFYNDYEKLGLVLGDSFFEENSQVSASIFAKFSGGNGIAGQYEQVWRYKLKDPKDLQIEDFQSLYA